MGQGWSGLSVSSCQFLFNLERPVLSFIRRLRVSLKVKLDELPLALELGTFLCAAFLDALCIFLLVRAAEGNLDSQFGHILGAQTEGQAILFSLLGAFQFVV